MIFARLEQTIRRERWRPYLIGCLIAVPVAFGMLQVWRHDDHAAWAWLLLYTLVGGFPIWWRTALRKSISTALLVGTFVPLLIH